MGTSKIQPKRIDRTVRFQHASELLPSDVRAQREDGEELRKHRLDEIEAEQSKSIWDIIGDYERTKPKPKPTEWNVIIEEEDDESLASETSP